MIAGKNPGLVWHSRRIGTKGHIVAASFYDAQGLTLLLLQNVAEDATLLAHKIFAARAQFVEHAPGDEHRCRDLRGGMAGFLAGGRHLGLEKADILAAGA